jgi:putative salt-induced outer membrane protein
MNRASRGRAVWIAWLMMLGGLFVPSSVMAQAPCSCPTPDPGVWIGTAGAGLSMTQGNTDTINFNLSFDVTRDPKTRNIMKWTGLYLRGEQESELVADRLSLGFRDEYKLSSRAYVFGQIDYLRDTFKLIDYLVAPTGGLGYRLVETPSTTFSADGGIGAVWEKNPGIDVSTDAAVTAGEKLEHKITATSTFRHAATALWKADDFADGLYTISVGLGARLSGQLLLSVDLLDTFQNKPPTPTTGKNDVALVTSIAATF